MVLGIPFLWISLYAARQVVSLRAAWPAGNPVRRRLVLIQGCIGVHAFVRSLTLLLAFATTSTGQLEDMREFVLGDLPGISYAALMVVLLGDHLTACAKRERRLGLASCCAPPGVALERLRLFGLLVSFLAGTGWVVAAVFLSSTLTAAAIATIDLARDVLFSTLFATASLLGFVAAGRVRASLLDSTAVSSLGAGRTVLAALSLTTAACFAARAAIVVAMDLAFGPRRSQALLLPHSTSSVVAVTVAYYAVSELACSAAWAYAMRCRLFTEEHHLLLERALLPSDFELDPAEVKDFSFLGAGGFGDVYQARYRDTPVAVKVFRAPAMSPVSSPIAPAAAAAGSDGDPLLLPASRGAGPASEGDSALWRAGLLDRAPLGRGGPDKPPTGYGAAASLVEEGSGRGSTAAAIAFPPHPTLHALHHARTRQRFVREVQLLCALRHPRIVQLFGYTFLDDRSLPPAQRSASAPARDTAWATAGGVCSVALVMEFVGKGSLYNLLHRSDHPLSPRQRLLLALDVAEGMSFLHASGVLHRDLKSANVRGRHAAHPPPLPAVGGCDASPPSSLIWLPAAARARHRSLWTGALAPNCATLALRARAWWCAWRRGTAGRQRRPSATPPGRRPLPGRRSGRGRRRGCTASSARWGCVPRIPMQQSWGQPLCTRTNRDRPTRRGTLRLRRRGKLRRGAVGRRMRAHRLPMAPLQQPPTLRAGTRRRSARCRRSRALATATATAVERSRCRRRPLPRWALWRGPHRRYCAAGSPPHTR